MAYQRMVTKAEFLQLVEQQAEILFEPGERVDSEGRLDFVEGCIVIAAVMDETLGGTMERHRSTWTARLLDSLRAGI